MITRKQYMNRDCTHAEYYADIAREAGLKAEARFASKFLKRCREALKDGDKHLNTIPLKEWDMMGYPRSACEAMRARGDYMTAAGSVSMWKQLAIQFIS